MNEEKLAWKEERREKILDCHIFSVWKSYCKAPGAQNDSGVGTFSLIDARDWAIVIPVLSTPDGDKFVMVWQWRFGSKEMSLEFPGGVFEPKENPEQAAARELQEETGYKPGKIKKIGAFSPNSAIMTNRVHFFLAEDLIDTGKQNLDADEYVEVALIDANEAIKGMGQAPYTHALMGSALALYFKERF